MSSQRLKKIESLLLREVSDILMREINDPRVAGVTVIGARVSADLGIATVYYHNHAAKVSREETEKGLESVRGAVRRIFSKRVTMKYLPEIRFRYDPSLEKAERINSLLKEISSQEAEREKPEE